MNRINAFTLVELAIVIVIIGLLVGGVLAGQELIMQAKIRNVLGQVKSYETAVIVFKDKYKCLPGDCPTVTIQRFFGSTVTGGNGDSGILNGSGPSESAKFWQHLGLANLIKGSYSGTYPSPLVAWRDVPGCSFDGCGIVMRYTTNFSPQVMNMLEIGKIENIGAFSYASAAVVDTQTAQSFDSKIDDGVANTGFLHGVDGNNTTSCSANYAIVGGADYRMNSSGIQCRMLMKSTLW